MSDEIAIGAFFSVFPLFFGAVFATILEGNRMPPNSRQRLPWLVLRRVPTPILLLTGLICAYGVLAVIVGGPFQLPDPDPARRAQAVRGVTAFPLCFHSLSVLLVWTAYELCRTRAAAAAALGLASWSKTARVPLKLSLATCELNGLRCGQPIERLKELGRPDNRHPLADKRFEYRELGLVVEHEGGRISYFGCILVDKDKEGFSPCRLVVELPGRGTVELGATNTRGDVQDALGKPSRRDDDADEAVFFYEIAKHELECEFGREGTLKRVNLFRG